MLLFFPEGSNKSDLRAKRCSWAWQVERVCAGSCSPARCCTLVSPPGGVALPAAGAGSPVAWPCLRSPPGSQRAPSVRQWGTTGKQKHREQVPSGVLPDVTDEEKCLKTELEGSFHLFIYGCVVSVECWDDCLRLFIYLFITFPHREYACISVLHSNFDTHAFLF